MPCEHWPAPDDLSTESITFGLLLHMFLSFENLCHECMGHRLPTTPDINAISESAWFIKRCLLLSEVPRHAYPQVIPVYCCPCGVWLCLSSQVVSYIWAGSKKSCCTELAAIRPRPYSTNSPSCRHNSKQDNGTYRKCREPDKSWKWGCNLQQKCHNVLCVPYTSATWPNGILETLLPLLLWTLASMLLGFPRYHSQEHLPTIQESWLLSPRRWNISPIEATSLDLTTFVKFKSLSPNHIDVHILLGRYNHWWNRSGLRNHSFLTENHADILVVCGSNISGNMDRYLWVSTWNSSVRRRPPWF